jgi:hypothetical protein
MHEREQETKQMTAPREDGVDKGRIVEQIADLSRLLGMIPSDDTIAVHEPVTQHSMQLSEWLRETRNAFQQLSLLLSRSLDLHLP